MRLVNRSTILIKSNRSRKPTVQQRLVNPNSKSPLEVIFRADSTFSYDIWLFLFWATPQVLNVDCSNRCIKILKFEKNSKLVKTIKFETYTDPDDQLKLQFTTTSLWWVFCFIIKCLLAFFGLPTPVTSYKAVSSYLLSKIKVESAAGTNERRIKPSSA